MAVIAILTDQTDFTGEFPITDHAVGVWRLSEAIVAQDESVRFPDAANYGRDLVPVGTAWISGIAHHHQYRLLLRGCRSHQKPDHQRRHQLWSSLH